MAQEDPPETQRGVVLDIVRDLSAVGLGDAHEIGHGGFGVVYRCTQVRLDRTVAVKVLSGDFEEEDLERFFREQRAMGMLTGHPNIVGVLEAGATENGSPFIVMQYHRRGSLHEKIRDHGPLPLEESLRLGVKLAGALETAHELSIVHRDVKPANILFTDYGEPALTDFGIAHIADGFETATGIVTGSPAFTAPEVLGGSPPNTSSDIYGLGATMFSALTGHAPFSRRDGEQLMAQFVRITTDPIPDLRTLGFENEITVLIERALSVDPSDRQRTAEVFGDELRNLQHNHGFIVDEMALQSKHARSRKDSKPVKARSFAGALPAIVAGGSHLPLELTSFIGRRHELAQAKRLLGPSHLVTLTGIGGSGKTRLALRVAANAKKAFAQGVWFVGLGELRDETLLVGVVAGALGLREGSVRTLNESLIEYLTQRELLVVLDNCEHLVDAVAKLVEIVLRSCPGVRILATSREPLGISGEAVLWVPPLAISGLDGGSTPQGIAACDAVALFAERAASVLPGFEVTKDNQLTVASICQRLDGLPLPIELAAARLRAMSPEQILGRLTDRFALLTRGKRDAPSRQQTLRLSVDWSYELCSETEREAWSRLSVFAGGFELDAAEFVCGDELTGDLLDIVSSLVDKSILVREDFGGAVRFRMLETVRSYGLEQAQLSGAHRDLRRRHRDWCEELTLNTEIGWISSKQGEWIARVKREQPNLREALEFSLSETDADGIDSGLRIAAALPLFWSMSSILNEGRCWLDRLLARDSGRATVERIRALYANSVLATLQGQIRAGSEMVVEGNALADQLGDHEMKVLFIYAEGRLALFEGALSRACLLLEDALMKVRTLDDLVLEVQTETVLGVAYDLNGETALALKCHEEVLALTESKGELVYQSYSHWALGVAKWRGSDSVRARSHLGRGLRIAHRVGDPVCSAASLEALAWVADSEHEPQRAAVLMGAAEAVGQSAGSSPVFLPDMQSFHRACSDHTRHVLGEKDFEVSTRAGATLSADEALSFALEEHIERTKAVETTSGLTKRENEVAGLVARGMTNKAIANELVISQRTAQGHVEHILTKLGFTSRVQIAAWVVERS